MLEDTAIITIVQNGNEFFKIWYNYYTKFIPKKNIFVINYNSTDGSTENLNCNILTFKNCSVENVPQGNKIINELKSDLLKKFKYVIYADYDEILFHPRGLDSIFDSKQRYYTPSGYEIVQNRHLEKSIDFSQPILSQRNYWYRCLEFDKPLVTSIDFNWANGNHSASISLDGNPQFCSQNAILQPNYTEDFYLIHLHKIDYNHCLSLNQKNIIEKGQPKSGGSHNFFQGEKFEQWWKDAERQLIPIPPKILNSNII